MSSDGVGVVGEDSTGSAHMDRVDSAVNTAGAVEGRVVSAALRLRPPLQLDEAGIVGEHLTPHVAPRVLTTNQSIVLFVSTNHNSP